MFIIYLIHLCNICLGEYIFGDHHNSKQGPAVLLPNMFCTDHLYINMTQPISSHHCVNFFFPMGAQIETNGGQTCTEIAKPVN